MAIDSDVLVVGAGLAGSVAALSAAREGADVRVVAKGESTLRQASGLIDALGYVPGDEEGAGVAPDRRSEPARDGGRAGLDHRMDEAEPTDPDADPVLDPFEAIQNLPARHPYRILGGDALRAGLALFDEAVGDAYRGGHTDRNALVATGAGTVKPTARYPAAVAPGLASSGGDALLVGFESLPAVDAPMAADRLRAAGVPFSAEGVTVRFPVDVRADADATRLASALDRDEPADRYGGDDGGDGDPGSAVEALGRTVAPHVEGNDRVGFPPVLGREHGDRIRAGLTDALGIPVFELPTGPPSVPGLRLRSILRDALDSAGVTLSTGNPVVDFEVEDGNGKDGEGGDCEGGGGRIHRVFVDREGARVPFGADEYVLATGGLVGGGIESDRSTVREPVFGCPVPHPADRYDWFVDDPFGPHPFARFGVVHDAGMRPLGPGGSPAFANLRAAGGVVGGADVARENSASGVSLATGLVAGREAGREAAAP